MWGRRSIPCPTARRGRWSRCSSLRRTLHGWVAVPTRLSGNREPAQKWTDKESFARILLGIGFLKLVFLSQARRAKGWGGACSNYPQPKYRFRGPHTIDRENGFRPVVEVAR